MEEQVTLVAKPAPREGAPTESGFAGLDTRTQQQSFQNLSVAAVVYAAVYFVAFTVGWTLHLVEIGRFALPNASNLIATVGSIGMSALVARTCWKCTAPSSFSTIAQVYVVAAALGIAANWWGWEEILAVEQRFAAGVPWVGVWIVMFPNIVMLEPRKILRSTFLAALTIPAVLAASFLVNGAPEGTSGDPAREALNVVLQLTAPTLICVGIAYYTARRVFCLARDVSEARRMGSYQLVEKLGAGGMGEVWRAQHRLLARPAAIKLIRADGLGLGPDDSAARTALRRFEREAQSTALLTSPHTVELYDFGITDDGTFYYVMELLEGLDLRTLVEETGPVPPARAVHFLRQACHSLADAHHRGMVHRDVKPANLVACRRGLEFDFTKVLDFGLVKEIGLPREDRTQLTMEGITSGTPAFMAPEMAWGRHDVDGRADLYALGCVGYWLLTGRLVFEGDNAMAILIQHAKEKPPPPSARSELAIDAELEAVILDCLAKSPDDRPSSASELANRLRETEPRIGAWTQDRAERWWRAHRPALFVPPDPASGSAARITVEAS